MFEGLENTLEAATKAIEVQAEADITVSFEPGLDEHVRREQWQGEGRGAGIFCFS